jgi:hypothetical protein
VPIKQYDTGASYQVKFLNRVEYVKIMVETVRGGGSWPKYGTGDFKHGPGIREFREDVCGECYDKIQAMLEPLREFLRTGGGRQEHHIPPVRDHEPPPDGRFPALLRALPFLGRARLPGGAEGE